MGAKKINQEFKEVKPSETRRAILKRKLRIRRIVGVLLIAGILWGGLAGGYHLVANLLADNATSTPADANNTLSKAGEARANGDTFEVEMDEETALMTLNQMTHQKVKAGAKYGAVEMNMNNINEMIHIVEEHTYENGDLMLRLLKKWKKGDFTYIVQDHNAILEAQNGNLGKAFDTMSEAEEKQYVKDTFGE